MHLTLLGEYNLNQYEIILYTYDNWSFAHLNYLFFLFHYNWLYHMYFARKGLYSQTYGFSSSHVWMWELDHKQGWALNKWCFWTVVLEKTLKSPLDCTEIKPVNPKGNQSWIFIGRADADAEAPILWPPDATSRLIWKDPDAGKDWRQEDKGTTEDEMVRWHHWLNGHEFEQAPGGGDGQGGLACCSPWSCKESDMTERLNWTELKICSCGCSTMYLSIVK